jgi:hypothetical protein
MMQRKGRYPPVSYGESLAEADEKARENLFLAFQMGPVSGSGAYQMGEGSNQHGSIRGRMQKAALSAPERSIKGLRWGAGGWLQVRLPVGILGISNSNSRSSELTRYYVMIAVIPNPKVNPRI